ncbi:glycosyltransferase [Geobacter sulfurreducens]|uniref:glycosyltransferase n=1 Tax=Geobacter sulfurreducens TaxID=35554 RepID=UPI0005D8D28D|nr:glycosyltransferase [Geobacter sulfurreducens]AJY69266.1 hypothetical protein RW64_06420 [Geobacter sulfurreducens]QVW34822.1 glycosyltransferase [Geobacter sulfurreducens]
MITKAINWIKENTVKDAGIILHSRNRTCYPAVSGYLIPTLLEVGELELARQYARWLTTVQNPDGSFSPPESSISFSFDTGQVVRGWSSILPQMPELEHPLRRACEWLISKADPSTGRLMVPQPGTLWNLGARGEVNEAIHLYCLYPLQRAADLLNEPRYSAFVSLSRNYYLGQSTFSDFGQPNALTHFFAYIQEALTELGCEDEARKGMASVSRYQQNNGAVPAYADVRWVCSAGLAQLAAVWFRLGERAHAEKALDFLRQIQNSGGGFFGSYGVEADYFPAVEVSWAAKYAIDACLRENCHQTELFTPQKPLTSPAGQAETDALTAEQWHRAIASGQSPSEIASRVRSGQVPTWATEILELTHSGERVLELGSGTAEISAFLATQGRKTVLLDYSRESLVFGNWVFSQLGLETETVAGDIRQPLALPDNSVDVVWSGGVLEHFSDDEITHILREARRVARRLVVSFVPNAKSMAYRLGKYSQEKNGTWPYGFEDPKATLKPLFERAGLDSVREFTVCPEHSINFLNSTDMEGQAPLWHELLKSMPEEEKSALDQGYLLCTVGWARPLRRLAVIPSDPLAAYELKGNAGILRDYYNPAHYFDEVYCFSPLETEERFAHGMHVVPTSAEQLPLRIEQFGVQAVRAYGGFWPADFACLNKARGVPVVVSVHDTNPGLLHDSVLQADQVWVVSDAVKALVTQRGVPDDKIRLLPNRVNFDTFRHREDDTLRAAFNARFPGRFRILHVGRKSPQKNLDTVIRALAELGPDFACIFVGQGDVTPYLELARQCGVAGQCHFIESIPNNELPIYYSFCDCMCVPSRWEGFGIVFIEALASEAIVVTADIPPMNEFVQHGHNGLLVKEYEEPAAVARAIRSACTDPELRHRLRAQSRLSVEKFSKQRIDAHEASLYEALRESAPSPPEHAAQREAASAAPPVYNVNPQYLEIIRSVRSSRNVVDLGCGNCPIEGATVGVDFYLEPKERALGQGARIDLEAFRRRNIRFVNQSIDKPLPFADKEFDFAYSHHVFEHLDDPATACREVMRIARAGAIVTPSPFAELMFGRPYHRWLVMDRGRTLYFFRKRPEEDRPFGNSPERNSAGELLTDDMTNPFDMVLNDGGWYQEPFCATTQRLSEKIRTYWYGHSPVMETIFLWRDGFDFKIIDD